MKARQQYLYLLLLGLLARPALASGDPVTWTARLEPADARSGEGARIVVTAKMAALWHIYALTQPGNGPVPTRIELVPGKALVAAGKPVQPRPDRKQDPGFNMDVEEYEGSVVFGVPVKLTSEAAGVQNATVRVRYQACSSANCRLPKTLEVPVSFTVAPGPARLDHALLLTTVPGQPAGGADAGRR